ncbi:MAG TPA: hypothetical protein VFN71_00920, partial [Methylomirabilota bacterium]|nr:hypothetical protein [Methylomirabilota bacterium]
AVAHLVRLRDRLDPFALATAIDRHLDHLVALVTLPGRAPAAPAAGATSPAARPPRFDYTLGNHLRRPRGAPASVTS